MRPTKDDPFLLSLFIISLTCNEVFGTSEELFEYSQPISCDHNEYFDTVSFSCVECDASKNLVPSTDRLQCACNKFSKVVGFKNGYPLCVACEHNAFVSRDGRNCISCKDSGCTCSRNEVKVERAPNGSLLNVMQCLPCAKGAYSSPDGASCVLCDNEFYNISAQCACPEVSHSRVGKYCLKKDDLIDWPNMKSTYLVKFESESVDSYYLRMELQATTYFCKKKNRVSCEHLSNMCAMTLFSNGMACMLFVQKHMSPTWLYYDEEQTFAALYQSNISTRYSLANNNNNSILNFTFAKFSLSGSFRSIGNSDMLCQMLKNVRFGVNINKKCRVTVKELLNANVEFYQPFLIFAANGKVFSHALPVLIKNANKDVNDISKAQFVRKFFLVDNISGFKTLPGFFESRLYKSPHLSVLRYAKSLQVLVHVLSGQQRGQIYPPIIIIEYEELSADKIQEDLDVVIEYEVTFVFKNDTTQMDIQISIGVLSGVALIWAGIKAWSYGKRNCDCILCITVLVWFLIYAMGAVADALIVTSIGACIYIFIFYKGQTVPHILLPDTVSDETIQIFTIIAFSFKIVEMIGFVYQYLNVAVFFIDWEQCKTAYSTFRYDSPHTSFRKTYSKRFVEKNKKVKHTSSEIARARKKRSSRDPNETTTFASYKSGHSSEAYLQNLALQGIDDVNLSQNSPVSVWRTYLIASEWLRLQKRRRINIWLQSISMILILEVAGLHFWALAIPELTGNKETLNVGKSFMLQYAVCALIYVFVYSIQWLTSIAFYEGYFKNSAQEFVDLCSVTNISVFILAYRYYGFYIHGRSIHGFADTDLPTLLNDLEREDNNLCAHRGLVPGTTEQAFILSVTQTFKNTYDELLKQQYATNNKENGNFLKRNRPKSCTWKETYETHSKLKQFLCQYIDHSFKDEDYIIKEQHLLEKLFKIVFPNSEEKSVFYIDRNNSFIENTLYGNEWFFATFEFAVFAFILVIHGDYILASTIVVVTTQILTLIIKYGSKRNLSNKSLLDERFLT